MQQNGNSLNEIYGDRQVITMANRIKFLHKRRNMLADTFRDGGDNKMKHGYKYRQNMTYTIADNPSATSPQRKHHMCVASIHKEKLQELKQLKNKNYQASKLTSFRLHELIRCNREKQSNWKRMRKMQVARQEQSSRERLNQYQHNRIQSIKMTNFAQYKQKHLSLKSLQIKMKLMREQDRCLVDYEQDLSIRSQLMRKIKRELVIFN